MKENEQYKEIELRSEEVQDVMNKIPTLILRCGITVLFCIVMILFVGSCLFKYPEVITAEVTISTLEPPVYVLARASGRLVKLYIKNGQVVERNSVLAVIENAANEDDIFVLQDKLLTWRKFNCSLEKGKELFGLEGNVFSYQGLGEIQTVYASFVSVLSERIRVQELGYYTKKRIAQEELIAQQTNYYHQVRQQNYLVEKDLVLAHSSYARDSILYNRNAMIITEYEQSSSRYLQSLQAKENARMALTQTAIQLAQSKEVLLDLDKQVMEELQTQTVNLKNATEQLMAQLMSWEQRYLLKSPINGKVTFLSLWSPNQNVESGASVFVVAPNRKSVPLGQALLPLRGSGKVKVGQRANIRLTNYPDMEFGYLRGEVRRISPVPTADGMYVVDIALPNGLQTNYGKELPITREMKGNADIVTDDVRLIERLIMPLKKIWEAQKDK